MVDVYRITEEAGHPAPRHHREPGFAVGSHHHRPPHIIILEALEHLSAQIAELKAEITQLKLENDRLSAAARD